MEWLQESKAIAGAKVNVCGRDTGICSTDQNRTTQRWRWLPAAASPS